MSKSKLSIGSLLTHSTLALVSIVMIFPMALMIILSLKSNPEQYSTLAKTLTSPYTIVNYIETLASDAFDIYFLNSLLVGVLVTAGNVLFCFLCGYGFARKTFKGKQLLFATILGVLIIPPQVIMIPLYRMIVGLGWINTYYALIIPWLVTPFGIFLVKQFIEALPSDMESSARIDGASEVYVLFRIVFPLCRPVLTVLAIYIFLGNWNSFLYPFLFTNDSAHRTLPVGLAFYVGKQSIDWGHLMAGASISALPVLTLFAFFQKHIIKGLTAGAVKE